jgi:hypothetical protein
LVEVCRVVETVLIDLDTIYRPRHSNDRLLLGLKGSLNEYELDLLWRAVGVQQATTAPAVEPASFIARTSDRCAFRLERPHNPWRGAMQERVVRQIRVLRAMRRELETGSR